MSATHKAVRNEVFSREEHAQCKGVTEILSRIGDKWTVLVVGALSRGTLRYGELQRGVEGISQRMLTLTLKQLEADGLVTRTTYPTIPPRVDYALSDLGRTLIKPLSALHEWSMEHGGKLLEARRLHAKRQAGA